MVDYDNLDKLLPDQLDHLTIPELLKPKKFGEYNVRTMSTNESNGEKVFETKILNKF